VQLHISFMLAPPTASLARPLLHCSAHACKPGAEHTAHPRASTCRRPFCHRTSSYKNPPPPVTYCPCPHRRLPLVRVGQPRLPYPVFPFWSPPVTAFPVALPSPRVGPRTPPELSATCRAVGATPRRLELTHAILAPPLSPCLGEPKHRGLPLSIPISRHLPNDPLVMLEL
jgi:hypothetical protein